MPTLRGVAMASTMARRWAPWLNLLLPGGGLILLGSTLSGLVRGLVVAGLANLALIAILMFPDEFSTTMRALLAAFASGGYVGTQLRLARKMRDDREREAAEERHRQLADAQRLLAAGDIAGALEMLDPLVDLARSDLLVAYRLAQAITAAGDTATARIAWQQVRRLDRHGIYRTLVRENEARLGRVERH